MKCQLNVEFWVNILIIVLAMIDVIGSVIISTYTGSKRANEVCVGFLFQILLDLIFYWAQAETVANGGGGGDGDHHHQWWSTDAQRKITIQVCSVIR